MSAQDSQPPALTLAEYKRLAAALWGEKSAASDYIAKAIKTSGENAIVTKSASEMMVLLSREMIFSALGTKTEKIAIEDVEKGTNES